MKDSTCRQTCFTGRTCYLTGSVFVLAAVVITAVGGWESSVAASFQSATSELFAGRVPVVMLGLAIPGDTGNAITRLTEKIERFKNGVDDVDFSSDRDDEFGELYDAIDGLTETCLERERQLERQVEFTTEVLDAVDDVFYALDDDGNVRCWNDRLVEVTGYTDEEIESMHALEFFAPADRDMIETAAEDGVQAGEARVEANVVTKDGESIPHEFTVVSLDDPDGNEVLAGIGRDVSERTQLVQELRTEKEHFRVALENAPMVGFRLDTDLRYTWITNPHPDFRAEDVLGKRDDELLPPEAAEAVMEPKRRVLETGEGVREEVTYELPSGTVTYDLTVEPMYDEAGAIDGLVCSSLDISDRKERERDLQTVTDHLRTVVTNVPVILFAIDSDGVFTLSEGKGLEILDLESDDVVGDSIHDRYGQYDELIADIERALAGERVHAVHDVDGTIFESSYQPVIDDGEVTGVIGVSFDVTERTEHERRLRERERQLSTLMDNVPGMVYRCQNEPHWPMEFVSQGCLEVTGYEPERLESGEVNWADDVIRGDNEAFWELVQRRLDENEPFEVTYPIETADGKRRWIKEQGRGVHGSDGSLEAIEGVMIDVTDRKRYEQQLSAQHERLQTIVQNVPLVLFALDADGVFTFSQGYGLDSLGLEPNAVVGESVFDVYSGYPDVTEPAREALAGEQVTVTAEIDDMAWDTWYEPVRNDDGDVERVIGVAVDVTDRVEHERELERTTELLEQAQRMASVGGYELDLRTDPPEVTVTDETYSILEVPPETEFDVEGAIELFHPDDRPRVREAVEDALERGMPFDFEARLITATGSQRWIHAVSEPVVEDGVVVSVRGSFQDITRRKERERELERTRNMLEQSQQLAEVGGWMLNLEDGRPYEGIWTDKFAEILELAPGEDLTFEEGQELFHPADRARVREAVERTIETGEGYDLEARLLTDDDTEKWIRSIGEVVEENGKPVRLQGSLQDITDRKEREQELERTSDLLQQTQRIAGVGGWELDLRTDPPYAGVLTDEVYRIHEVPSDEEFDMAKGLEFYHPEDRPQVRAAVERAIERGESYSLEARLVTAEGNQRWVKTTGKAIEEDDEIVKVRGAFQDITDRKEYELALKSIHEATRALLHTETQAEVAELVAETAKEVLDVTAVSVYQLSSERNRLEPIASTAGFGELVGDEPSVEIGDTDSIIWDTFVTETQTIFDGTETVADSPMFGTDADGGVLVPIGAHGVFVVVAPSTAIDGEMRRLVETLVATTEAAFDRLESEASLRERDAELEERNQRLRRQIQINDIIRTVGQSLIGTTSREEIEDTVCAQLADSEHVAFAWIGAPDAAETELLPRAWAGSGQKYLDTVSLDLVDGPTEPAVTASLTEQPTVVRNAVEDLQAEPWRKTALAHDFSSCLAVPLTYGEYTYGVLSVYANDPNGFTDLERTVFAELGASIANGINAVETREGLHAQSHLELTLRIDTTEAFLTRIASQAGCRVEYEGLGAGSSGETQLFFVTEGANPAAVTDVLDGLVSVSSYRQIGDGGDGRCLFEVTVAGPVLASRLVRHGGSPQSIRADESGMDVVVDVPTTTTVRQFVEMLRGAYDDVDLRTRRHVDHAMHTRQQLVTELFESLTDRQIEVLRTAYFAGFFDWPRESTGEDVADMLGVSQPTVNRHLRLGQHGLLEQLFGAESPMFEAVESE